MDSGGVGGSEPGGAAGGGGERVRLLWPAAAVLAGAGLVVTFVAFRPGIMTWDSFNMWRMGEHWSFHDHHHPLIGVLLGVSRLVSGSPSAYLLLQLGLWWGGAYLFAVGWRSRVGRWGLLAPVLGFLPFNLSLMGYIHKTPLLASCFLFAGGWLLVLAVRGRRPSVPTSIGLLVLLYVGAVVRGYSYLAAVPIVAYWAWLTHQAVAIRVRRAWWCAAVAVAVVAGFAVADRLLTSELLDARRSFKSQIVYRYDLAAIRVLTGRAYAVDLLRPQFHDRQAAVRLYRQQHGMWKIYEMYRRVDDAQTLRSLRSEWLRAVVENPRAYAAHRAHAVSRSLGLRNRVLGYRSFDTDSPENTSELRQPDSRIRDAVTASQMAVRDLFFMRPWFWAAANLLLSVAAAALLLAGGDRARGAAPHAVMLWSGLLLLLPYLLVSLDNDARFTYWVTVSTSFGGVGLASAALASRYPGDDENQASRNGRCPQ